MKYPGSKRRIARDILPIILRGRKPGQWYVEPFVGGANSFMHVQGPKLGADSNLYAVALLRAVASGWEPPPVVTLEGWRAAKDYPHLFDPALVGFCGLNLSFGAKWFCCYARNPDSPRYPKSVLEEQFGAVFKLRDALRSGGEYELKACSYDTLEIPPDSIIYCDPPYRGVPPMHRGKHFDHDRFYRWCVLQVALGHRVYVSEYSAPEHWVCVWERTVSLTVYPNRTEGGRRVEKLFEVKL